MFETNKSGIQYLPTSRLNLSGSKTYSILNDSKFMEVFGGYTKNIDAFLLMTDGLKDILYKEDSRYLMPDSIRLINANCFTVHKKLYKYSKLSTDDISFIAVKRKGVQLKTMDFLDKWICKCTHANNFGELKCPKCGAKYHDLYIKPDLFEIYDKSIFFASLDKYIKSDEKHVFFGVRFNDRIAFEEYLSILFKKNELPEHDFIETLKTHKKKDQKYILSSVELNNRNTFGSHTPMHSKNINIKKEVTLFALYESEETTYYELINGREFKKVNLNKILPEYTIIDLTKLADSYIKGKES